MVEGPTPPSRPARRPWPRVPSAPAHSWLGRAYAQKAIRASLFANGLGELVPRRGSKAVALDEGHGRASTSFSTTQRPASSGPERTRPEGPALAALDIGRSPSSGYVLEKEEKVAEARSKAGAPFPPPDDATIRCAGRYFGRGRKTEAKALYREALRLDPGTTAKGPRAPGV